MYQPIMDNNEISKLKGIKNLILTAAIISTVFVVPYIGMLLGLCFQIPMIAQIIVVIITLHKVRGTSVPKIGLILTLIASIISIVGFLFLIFYYTSIMSTVVATPYATSSSDELPLVAVVAVVLYFVLGLIAWGCYVASAIVLFINMSTLNKEIQRQTYDMTSQSMLAAHIYAYHQPQGGVVGQPLFVQTTESVTEQPTKNPFHTPKTEVENDTSEESLFSQGEIEN